MQNTPEFRALASIVEYSNANIAEATIAIVSSLNDDYEWLLIVANKGEEESVGQFLNDTTKVATLEDAKKGDIPKQRPDLFMVLTPLATQQLLIEMSGLGMRHGELSKAEVYNTLLTNGMIRPEHQKNVYIRAKEIEERT